MKAVLENLKKFSDTDSIILMTGETGVGKSFLSGTVHFNSPRRRKPFIIINCANIQDTFGTKMSMKRPLNRSCLHKRWRFSGGKNSRCSILTSGSADTGWTFWFLVEDAVIAELKAVSRLLSLIGLN